MTQESLKVEYIPTHYRRKHNVSGTTQVSFFAKFKASSNKLSQKRYSPQCFKEINYFIFNKITGRGGFEPYCIGFPGKVLNFRPFLAILFPISRSNQTLHQVSL